jgi:hypothetical protein
MDLNLQLAKATRIVFQTAPYLAYRAAVYGVLLIAVAVALLLLALIGSVFGGAAALILFVVLAVAVGGGLQLLRDYVLYMLQAGHIAIVTELITRGELPKGIRQTEWAKQRVVHYFKEISVLSLVDHLVRGVVGVVNRTLLDVMTALPIPGTDWLARLAERVVHFSLTYVDESVIAYTFKTGNENVYDAAKSGILVYCQSWKSLLRNAVALTVLGYALTAACTIVFLVPLGVAAYLLPASWSVARLLLFLLAVWMGLSVKWILFDPIACTSTILTFLQEAETRTPDPTWEGRIEAVSDKFRELKQKAAEYLQQSSHTTTGQPSEPGPETHPA